MVWKEWWLSHTHNKERDRKNREKEIDKRGGGNKSKNIKRDAWLSEKEVWENQDWFDRRF